MTLKHIPPREWKIKKLNGTIKNLTQQRFRYEFNAFKTYNIIDEAIKNWKDRDLLINDDIDENVILLYGYSENEENDLEFLLVKILFLWNLYYFELNILSLNLRSDFLNQQISKLKHLSNNVILNVNNIFKDEYKIYWKEDWKEDYFPTTIRYEPIETTTIIENLHDIDQKLRNPIEELLKPMKNDAELRGLISEIYANLEPKRKDILNKNYKNTNLNKVDSSILKQALGLAFCLANQVDSSKGHIGESNLKVKDIAHNFALNASLIYKLIKKN